MGRSNRSMFNNSGLNEECGVFGIWNHPEAAQLTYMGLHSLQHRGQEGAGIVVSDDQTLKGERGLGLLTEAIKDTNMENLKGYPHAIGHVRYATSGNKGIENIQPFLYHFYDMSVGICHNGNLINAESLRQNLEKHGAIFHSSSDTEVIMHLIRRSKAPTFEEALKESLRQIKGGFTFAILTEDALYGAVDPNAIRPLVVGRMENGAYILASETCAIDVLGAEFVQDIHAGEYVIINDDGIVVKNYTRHVNTAISAMEYIYFARPDSVIDGVSVHESRVQAGKILAEHYPVEADVVIGVPDSGLDAALGYSEKSGIPYGIGLIKNKYIGRTFISPGQSERLDKVRIKLSPVQSVIEGKKVVLVDDSIVRGTTSRQIVKLLQESGAREIHMRISAPPFLHPCYYGTDIDSEENLIACHHSLEEIAKLIGVDSLGYLDVENLGQLIGSEEYCGACFHGEYPTRIPTDLRKDRFERKLSHKI